MRSTLLYSLFAPYKAANFFRVASALAHLYLFFWFRLFLTVTFFLSFSSRLLFSLFLRFVFALSSCRTSHVPYHLLALAHRLRMLHSCESIRPHPHAIGKWALML